MKSNITSLNLAITCLLAGRALSAVQGEAVSHALTQWSKGQRTPVYQTIVALECSEAGKNPASKGLTVERIRGMSCPVSSRASKATLCELLEVLEKGSPATEVAESWSEVFKLNKMEAKQTRVNEILEKRTDKQTKALAIAKTKRYEKAQKEAIEDSYFYLMDVIKSGFMPAEYASSLRDALHAAATVPATVVAAPAAALL